MTISLNIGGAYKNLSSCKVNIGGSWKAVSGIQVNIGGTWKSVYNLSYSAMRIATSTTGTNNCAFYKASLVNTTKTTAIEAEIKVETSGSDSSQIILIRNGAKQAGMALKSGSVICNYSGTSPYTHTVDTSTYHTYRVELQGTTQVVFYVDGVSVHTATYANLPASGVNVILFGDAYTTVNIGGSVVWKSFKYNLDLVGTPATYVVWDPTSKPTTQGWTLDGTDLATIITE